MKRLSPISIVVFLFFLLALNGCFDSSSDGSDSVSNTTPPTSSVPPPWDIETGPSRECTTAALSNNCSDGIDNDGDGLVDWQYDLGCSGPNDNEEVDCRENEDGWTTYDPHPTDTDIIYVSSSVGDDTFSGFLAAPNGSGDGPVKTIAAAIALVRDGFADWILFRRGDTWTDETIGLTLGSTSGLSPEYPIVIASYGPSTVRPKFNYSDTGWFRALRGALENVSILGLELNQYKFDPNDPSFSPVTNTTPAISWLSSGGNFLLEDCKIKYAQVNIQDYNSPTGYFEIRRNILTNSYSINSHAQSIFTSVHTPLLIEENIMNQGGWNDEFRLVLTAPQTDLTTWQAITDGAFDIELQGNIFQISGADFSGAADLNGVALALETAINTVVAPNSVSIAFTAGNVIKIASSNYGSDDAYSITAYTGGGGTDISVAGYLNATAAGVPASTIFNRNMYLSHGRGNTVVRGNIDANGASGGTQLRMGGLVDNNSFLQNPISITVGHAQNDPYDVSAIIKNNVILGSRDIDTQVQGTGIDISSNEVYSTYGPSYINNVNVYNNIIANTTDGTSNIKGIVIGGNGPHTNLNIHDNVIYNWTRSSWPNPNDHRAYAFIIRDLNAGTSNVSFKDNIIQQTVSGYVARSAIDPLVTLSGNSYYSAETDTDALWSKGWFDIGGTVTSADWVTQTNDTSTIFALHAFSDPTAPPNMTIADYHQAIGGIASFDAFIAQALQQSRLSWDDRYTADAVNTWIRAGFDLTYQQ